MEECRHPFRPMTISLHFGSPRALSADDLREGRDMVFRSKAGRLGIIWLMVLSAGCGPGLSETSRAPATQAASPASTAPAPTSLAVTQSDPPAPPPAPVAPTAPAMPVAQRVPVRANPPAPPVSPIEYPAASQACESDIEHVSSLGSMGSDCDTARRVATAYDTQIMGGGSFPEGQPVPVADGWSWA